MKLCGHKLGIELNKYKKSSDKEKYVHSGYGIVFDGKDEWSFNINIARNVVS